MMMKIMNVNIVDLLTKVLVELITIAVIFCCVTVVATIVTAVAGTVGVKATALGLLLYIYIMMDVVKN